ncbi:MAG TPA: DUF6186 family protein [Actinomycetota bacterium]|nr:DUF6186 family protein [Actinomycetota bacterium]
MSSRFLTEAGFVALALVGVLLEVLARLPGSRIPTLGSAVTRAMRSRSGRVGIIAGWAWIGLHFFAR